MESYKTQIADLRLEVARLQKECQRLRVWKEICIRVDKTLADVTERIYRTVAARKASPIEEE